MIVDPNESRWTGFLRNSDGKISRRKMILLIVLAVHLVFTVLDACVLHCMYASWLINITGPGHLIVSNLEYQIEPRQNEILMSWTETVIHGARQGKEEKFTRSIPLDPLPPEFAQCYVEVTVDPDAPPVRNSRMPVFEENNVIRTEPEPLTWTQAENLPPNMVFHLAVRPEDLQILSHEFIVTAGVGGYKISRILFPLSGSRNDSRREMLLSRTERYPFFDDLNESEVHWQKKPSVGGMLLRIILMPIVSIGDYFALILYIRFLFWWAAAFK